MYTRWVQRKDKLKNHKHRVSIWAAVFCFCMAFAVTTTESSQKTAETDQSTESHQSPTLQSPDQWTSLDGTSIKSGWSFDDGFISLSQLGPDQSDLAGGHIITKDEFEDFDLEFEWKIESNGNSGIKYMVQRYSDRHLGLEYQIYDDDGTHRVEPENSTGAIYDLFAPAQDKPLKTAGQWNKSRIVVQDTRIQHWLNGKLITTATMHNQEWNDRVAASKFNDVPDFCKSRRGRLMLTDHGSNAWYRILSFKAGQISNDP
jgi:hypothetical protein